MWTGCSILANNLSQRGHQVTVIDNDPLAFEGLGPAYKGNRVVGVGFDRDILIQAGIQTADALASVTVSDEANVVAARTAKQVFHVPRVAARVYDPRKAEIYRAWVLLPSHRLPLVPTDWLNCSPLLIWIQKQVSDQARWKLWK